MELTVHSLDELTSAAKKLLKEYSSQRLFAFYAPMAAGKTTFINTICKELGVNVHVSSPTFPIVNEYITDKGQKIFHFDFYRLKNKSEAFDLGCEEYFSSGFYCFIEWPENIGNLLPPECISVKMSLEGEIRKITISK